MKWLAGLRFAIRPQAKNTDRRQTMTKDRKFNLIIACIAASKLNEKDKKELIGFIQRICKGEKSILC